MTNTIDNVLAEIRAELEKQLTETKTTGRQPNMDSAMLDLMQVSQDMMRDSMAGRSPDEAKMRSVLLKISAVAALCASNMPNDKPASAAIHGSNLASQFSDLSKTEDRH